MKKIERLIAIVMILLQQKSVPASEFAKIMGVSIRTIQRDMDSLVMANIPIYAMQGSQGGYQLASNYKFDKRLVTQEDIENISLGLEGVGALLFNNGIERTLAKIKAMTNERVQPGLAISFIDFVGREDMKSELQALQDKIDKRQSLYIEYINQKGIQTVRHIEPYQLVMHELKWYVWAYCRLRQSYRYFKLSRILTLELGYTFSYRKDALPAKPFSGVTEEVVMTDVLLSISVEVVDEFIERCGRENVQKKDNITYKVSINLPMNRYGFQFIASYGVSVKILEPSYYKEAYVNYLDAIRSVY